MLESLDEVLLLPELLLPEFDELVFVFGGFGEDFPVTLLSDFDRRL